MLDQLSSTLSRKHTRVSTSPNIKHTKCLNRIITDCKLLYKSNRYREISSDLIKGESNSGAPNRCRNPHLPCTKRRSWSRLLNTPEVTVSSGVRNVIKFIHLTLYTKLVYIRFTIHYILWVGTVQFPRSQNKFS